MVVKNRETVQRFRSMARARVGAPNFIANFNLTGLVEVWAVDGRAYVFPGSGKLLICDWFSFIRYYQRHNVKEKVVAG